MKKYLYRFLAILLCVCQYSLSVSLAESLDSEGGELPPERLEQLGKEILILERFGDKAQVEMDANGEPVTVNGYPVRQVRAGFNNLGQEAFQMTIDFMDYPFWQTAAQYDGNLAAMSLIMASCANRCVGYHGMLAEDFDPALNVEHFFSDAGFTDIRKDDYSKVPTMFTVSTAMAQRKMTSEGEEPFTLIAIGVCGEGYANEWESNMTAGTGEIHQGFESAAQLVVDRLAGYIATRGIQGRIKVWISGFSRAAAVSNVAAGMLVHTGFLPKEDVYAYTFATPAAIKNPPQEGYENIFNIISPSDPVPQVMPAEWGYGRYGTDLFLHVPEFSSYEGVIEKNLRHQTNKSEYGVEYNYSPSLAFRTRLLLSMLMELITDADTYNERFQSALVGLMHDNALTNTLPILRNLMQSIHLSDPEDQTRLNHFIDFFIRMLQGIVTHSEYGDANWNDGEMMYRMMVEHTPNAYISSLYTIRTESFVENDRCCYVMVRGPVSVTLWGTLLDGTIIDQLTVHSDGTITESAIFQNLARNAFATERKGDTTFICVPLNADFRVTWTAENSGTVESLYALATLQFSSVYPGAISERKQVQAGETGLVFQNTGHDIIALDGFSDTSFSANTLAEFMHISSPGFQWRTALTVICALSVLLLCIILCLIAARKPSRKKAFSFFTWIFLCVLGIAAVESETAFWFFADQPWVRFLWKSVAALSFLPLFLLIHKKEGRLLSSFFPSLLMFLAADLVFLLHPAIGWGMFLLSYALLGYQLQRRNPLSMSRWILWALASAAVAAMILLIHLSAWSTTEWAAVICTPVLLFTAFCAGNQKDRLRASPVLLLVSTAMQMLFYLVLNDPLVHTVSVFLFYTALLTLTISRPSADTEKRLVSVK